MANEPSPSPDDESDAASLDPTITEPPNDLGETVGSVDAARDSGISFDGDLLGEQESLPKTTPEGEATGTLRKRFGDYEIERGWPAVGWEWFFAHGR